MKNQYQISIKYKYVRKTSIFSNKKSVIWLGVVLFVYICIPSWGASSPENTSCNHMLIMQGNEKRTSLNS